MEQRLRVAELLHVLKPRILCSDTGCLVRERMSQRFGGLMLLSVATIALGSIMIGLLLGQSLRAQPAQPALTQTALEYQTEVNTVAIKQHDKDITDLRLEAAQNKGIFIASWSILVLLAGGQLAVGFRKGK